MVSTRVIDETAITPSTYQGDEWLYCVDDPSGTPLNRKIRARYLAEAPVVVTDNTGTISPTLVQANGHFECTYNSGTTTFTCPADASVEYPLNTTFTIRQATDYRVTITAAGTINGITVSGNHTTAFKGAVAWVKKIAADSWVVYGDIAESFWTTASTAVNMSLDYLFTTIMYTGSSSAVFTIPNTSSVNWQVGDWIDIVRGGTGALTITGASGVDVVPATAYTNNLSVGYYRNVRMQMLTGNTWYPKFASDLPVPKTVGFLASSAVAGERDFVTDATSTTFNSIVAGGGGNSVPVTYDGSNWRVG